MSVLVLTAKPVPVSASVLVRWFVPVVAAMAVDFVVESAAGLIVERTADPTSRRSEVHVKAADFVDMGLELDSRASGTGSAGRGGPYAGEGRRGGHARL